MSQMIAIVSFTTAVVAEEVIGSRLQPVTQNQFPTRMVSVK
jgi:hypothetical protein